MPSGFPSVSSFIILVFPHSPWSPLPFRLGERGKPRNFAASQPGSGYLVILFYFEFLAQLRPQAPAGLRNPPRGEGSPGPLCWSFSCFLLGPGGGGIEQYFSGVGASLSLLVAPLSRSSKRSNSSGSSESIPRALRNRARERTSPFYGSDELTGRFSQARTTGPCSS